MSAIFGIFHLDGRPVSRENIEAIKASMDYWGPDGSGIWRNGPVGLGHLMRHDTPESLGERLPLEDASAGLTITAAARLDNRDELFEALRVPHIERNSMPDSSIILKAYQKWGEACAGHLLGDWAFAIWDASQKKLFVARDHHGSTGLFYYYDSHFFVFASCLKGLLALPEVPRQINEESIIHLLVVWNRDGHSTAYKNIFRIPPAHQVSVEGEKINLHQYWHLEDAPEIRFRSDQEYVDAFLDIYTEAVRCRLRGLKPVGITLSGGLDSGSVAALAARELKSRGQRLKAFTSVPLYNIDGLVSPDRFGDESPFVEAVAGLLENVDVTYVRAENTSPVQGVKHALDLLDEPIHSGNNQYWNYEIMKTAQSRGVGTMLGGRCGNGTISWDGLVRLSILARNGRWSTLWQEIKAWNATTGKPIWRIIAGQTIKPLIPPTPLNRIRTLISGQEPWEPYSALNPQLARSLALTARMYANGHDPSFKPKPHPRQNQYDIIRPGKDLGLSWIATYCANFDLSPRDPTADKRLMEFCLGLPLDQFFRHGQNRFLIRRAMEGILPPMVQWNFLRGKQGADLAWRTIKSREEIEFEYNILRKSHLVQKYLSLPKIDDIINFLRKEDISCLGENVGTILLRALSVGFFFRRFE